MVKVKAKKLNNRHDSNMDLDKKKEREREKWVVPSRRRKGKVDIRNERDGLINGLICSIAILEAFEALVQLLDPDDEVGDGVKEPVEEEGGGDEERVALALHDGFLVAEVFGGGAGLTVAGGARLVFPIDVHQKEETKGHHREEGLQQVPRHRHQTLAQRVQPRDR